MLSSIIRHSLRFRGVVVVTAALVMGYGIYQTSQSSLDVFPDFVPPQVTIQTEVPGLAPEQVEKLVTYPIESAVSGIANLDTVRSESIQGLSVVTVSFSETSDVLMDRQLLAERMTEVAGHLPKESKAPTLSPLVSSTMDLLKIGLTSGQATPMEMRTLADWQLKPLLLAVPGVADVSVVGGEVEQMQIQVNPAKLLEYKITLAEVIKAAGEAGGIRGAGYIETTNQRLLIATDGQLSDPAGIGSTVIKGAGGDAVRLRDVAEIKKAAAPKSGDALIQGKPGILLAMTSQYGTNTLDVTRRVEAALADFQPALDKQNITLHGALHRPANFIEIALGHIGHSLAIGAVLVVIVLLVFLRSPRTAFISFLSIPLSLLAAVIVFRAFGVTLNTMTLGGFAVAIGVVVDDAIIDVENIVRRLRENATLAVPKPYASVILDASVEVRGAIVYATLIVMAAFIPVFMLGGIQGRFFLPLGLAFVMATIASLLVAVTVTPALCSLMLGKLKEEREPFYLRGMKWLHSRCLRGVARFPKTIFLIALLVLGGVALLVPGLKTSFLPDFREGHFVMQLSAVSGTSLPEMSRIGASISKELLEDPRILSVQEQAGRSEAGVDTWGPERSEFHIELKPGPGTDEVRTQEDIRALAEKYPGLQSEVLTFLGDRISETISGETSEIVLSLYGDDLDALEKSAAEVAVVLGKVSGASDVMVQSASESPRLVVRLKPGMLERLGIRSTEVLDVLQTVYQGTEVAQLYQGSQLVPLVVTGGEEGDVGGLARTPLVTTSGAIVQLREVADVFSAAGRSTIRHEGGRRRQVITCNTQGRSVAEVVADARKDIAKQVDLGKGMQLVFTGAAEAQAEAHRNLVVSSSLALMLVVLLLWAVFRSGRNVTLVMVNLPFAIVGGVVALWISGLPVSLGALVGMVTLFGVSTRNAIMMLSHYEHLVHVDGSPWNLETAIRGAGERMVPVLMTATVTALALLPIALRPEAAGQEIEGPMAIVILGGLISSTLLNLLLLPALALKFGYFGRGPHMIMP
ncbi:efflux RND transporter permease subunit [Luteolibacter yonseiensis]|uniref:Efflux RND transporter permease subunit n=1 Tax=Luteolibacter yonseiensis TaxID=1144680 RepID=A0A934R850_9BACT|nr:efflux RND transporter permease subunit [Luteolibacter yonseiensis]MBK1816985.1 efflux RND transporter permease subunit [Luteolibacter yonseiensis]